MADDKTMIDPKRQARRRLVRGAFAAPAVLALHSGSAFAMASNLRCVNNQVGSPVSPGVSTTTDHFVRVRLWSLRSGLNANNPRWFLRGSDIDALRLNSSSVYNTFLKPGEWWEFNPATQKLVNSKLTTDPRWSNGNSGVLANDGAYVAIRINASTTDAGIVGVVDGNLTGSAVSGLCWTSFVTAAA